MAVARAEPAQPGVILITASPTASNIVAMITNVKTFMRNALMEYRHGQSNSA